MAQHAQKPRGAADRDDSDVKAPRPSYRRNNRRSLIHPASAADGSGPPEVYWSEGVTPSGTGSHAQGQPFTFLREPTPEPDDRGEKRRPGVAGGYYYEDNDDGEVRYGADRRICGVRPVAFWGIVAVTLMILVGVAVGVGVGVGMQKPTAAASTTPDGTR